MIHDKHIVCVVWADGIGGKYMKKEGYKKEGKRGMGGFRGTKRTP